MRLPPPNLRVKAVFSAALFLLSVAACLFAAALRVSA